MFINVCNVYWISVMYREILIIISIIYMFIMQYHYIYSGGGPVHARVPIHAHP